MTGVGGNLNSRCEAPWQELNNTAFTQINVDRDPACFSATLAALRYDEAKQNCSDQLGSLASMKDLTSQQFLIGLLNTNMIRRGRVYIGEI